MHHFNQDISVHARERLWGTGPLPPCFFGQLAMSRFPPVQMMLQRGSSCDGRCTARCPRWSMHRSHSHKYCHISSPILSNRVNVLTPLAATKGMLGRRSSLWSGPRMWAWDWHESAMAVWWGLRVDCTRCLSIVFSANLMGSTAMLHRGFSVHSPITREYKHLLRLPAICIFMLCTSCSYLTSLYPVRCSSLWFVGALILWDISPLSIVNTHAANIISRFCCSYNHKFYNNNSSQECQRDTLVCYEWKAEGWIVCLALSLINWNATKQGHLLQSSGM